MNDLSLEVLKTDIDDFDEDSSTPVRRSFNGAKNKNRRRRSCVCSWCGGASALEKAIQNHPDIPNTLCNTLYKERWITHDGTTTPYSDQSQKSSRRSRRTNTLIGTPKKSIFGNPRQGNILLDISPCFLGRKSQRMKTSIFDGGRGLTPLLALQETERQNNLIRLSKSPTNTDRKDTDEQASDSSITLDESPSPVNLIKKSSGSTFKRRPSSLANVKPPSLTDSPLLRRHIFSIYSKEQAESARRTMTETKESPRVLTIDTTKDKQLTTLDKVDNTKRKRTKKSQTQKNSLCIGQKIKNLYGSNISPRLKPISQKSQIFGREITQISTLLMTKKTTSSISWGSAPYSPIQKVRQSERRQKTEQSEEDTLQAKLALWKVRPVEKQKVVPQIIPSLNNIQKLKESYQSLTSRTVNSPRAKHVAKKEWIPTMSQLDKYTLAVYNM